MDKHGVNAVRRRSLLGAGLGTLALAAGLGMHVDAASAREIVPR